MSSWWLHSKDYQMMTQGDNIILLSVQVGIWHPISYWRKCHVGYDEGAIGEDGSTRLSTNPFGRISMLFSSSIMFA